MLWRGKEKYSRQQRSLKTSSKEKKNIRTICNTGSVT